jgi:Putative MetA-pathway of phenol degradation
MRATPFIVALVILAYARVAFAAVPLAVDDADPVDFEHLQLNSGLQFSQTASADLYDYSVNPVYGITPRSEFGVTFGHQSQYGGGNDADGISDLILETKWRLIGTATNLFKLSVRFDLKLPTASERLGTGEPDADIILIATRNWGNTYLDWNIGYTAVDAVHSNFDDDHWFLGQAVRHQLNDRWTLIGDAYVTLPQGKAGGSANCNFEGGAQFTLCKNFLLSVLAGSAVGRNSPDLTGYFGFTWTF